MYSPNLNNLMKMLKEDLEIKKDVAPVNTIKQVESSDLPFSIFPKTVSGIGSGSIGTKKQRVLFVSDHCHGYNSNSKVSWNLVNIISKQSGIELVHFGINQNMYRTADHRHYPGNVKYYSVSEITKDKYGIDDLIKCVEEFKPNTILFYHNSETLFKYSESLLNSIYKNFKTIYFIDLLYYNVPADLVSDIEKYADRVYVSSEFYKKRLLECNLTKPVELLRYGLDKRQLIAMEKKTARYRINLSETGFIILSPFENIHKNRYDIIIKAYVKLITRYPDTDMHLFCLCDKSDDGGYPIIDLYKQEFKNNNSDFSLHTGKIMLVQNNEVFNDEVKNVVFNCVDVAVCCSETANIELNPLELMSVGVPQIITDAGAYGEYINESNGTPLKIQMHSYLANNGSLAYLSEVRTVNSEDVFLAMEKYLKNRELLKEHGEAARTIVSDWEINCQGLIRQLL
jgi:hypothetical protein